MPAWLVWYSGMYLEIKFFFGALAAVLIVFTLCFTTSVDRKVFRSTKLLYIIACLALFALAILLPDGRTAISIYNAF